MPASMAQAAGRVRPVGDIHAPLAVAGVALECDLVGSAQAEPAGLRCWMDMGYVRFFDQKAMELE
ncbi:hypothetical protein CCO03_07250 [Comamonas serinivorans]|uniref:Uncharacterized protein n=1 Tax=Comamonas serinivorans TaxID=1082851 RepID=A0A1Y0EMD3_9BURK|nr:hypothetical protein CCO03_07250 [Comamonas serinivorans]